MVDLSLAMASWRPYSMPTLVGTSLAKHLVYTAAP